MCPSDISLRHLLWCQQKYKSADIWIFPSRFIKSTDFTKNRSILNNCLYFFRFPSYILWMFKFSDSGGNKSTITWPESFTGDLENEVKSRLSQLGCQREFIMYLGGKNRFLKIREIFGGHPNLSGDYPFCSRHIVATKIMIYGRWHVYTQQSNDLNRLFVTYIISKFFNPWKLKNPILIHFRSNLSPTFDPVWTSLIQFKNADLESGSK